MSPKVKKLTTMSVLIALSIALIALVHFPIFPAAPYLEYDPADIPIILGTLLYGPLNGLVITVIAATIQAFTVSASSGVYGLIMHVLATGSFVIVAGLIYKRKKTLQGIIIALLAGVLTMTVVMVAANLIITPAFLGAPVEEVIPLLLPVIAPFNLIKAGINGFIAFVLVKRISVLLGIQTQKLINVK